MFQMFFDQNNRMHVIFPMQDRYVASYDGYSATHVGYAYSDDGGNTFYRANGTKYESFPITQDNADIVAGPAWSTKDEPVNSQGYALYPEGLGIGLDKDGKTLVTFTKKDKVDSNTSSVNVYYSKWDGTHWTAPEIMPNISVYAPSFYTGSDGINYCRELYWKIKTVHRQKL